jgi:hypothetical protein
MYRRSGLSLSFSALLPRQVLQTLEATCELHAPTALSPEKEFTATTDIRPSGPHMVLTSLRVPRIKLRYYSPAAKWKNKEKIVSCVHVEDVSELRPSTGLLSVICECGEPRWNGTDREKPNNSEKNVSQCHFVHHKSQNDWPGREPGLRGERPATNRLSHGTTYWYLTQVTACVVHCV